jgi:phenylacetate-CoA ligase
MGLQSIYDRLPVPLQNAMVSARGMDFRFRRASDRVTRRQLELLLRSQWWSPEQMAAYQSRRLRALLRTAFRDVPHFRELAARLGCRAEDFHGPEDLRRLPILEKRDVRGREERFLGRLPLAHSVLATSGSTGTPLRVYESRRSFSLRWGFMARLRAWAGVHPIRPRRAQFTGRPIVPGAEGPFWRSNLPGHALLFSTAHISAETAPAYARALRRFAPEVMEGYPSAIRMLARLCTRRGVELPRPRAVITTAETLTPEARAELEAAYRCPVFDQYAAGEPSCFWADCEHGTMHVHAEYGISEIVDEAGEPVPPGGEGTVVVTPFLNPVMPLLRYRLGDVAVRGSGACPCGRALPVVERVVGRTDDVLFVPGRGYLGRLDPVFKGIPCLAEAQIVQESLDRLVVRIVPDACFGEDAERTLVAALRARVGEHPAVEVQRLETIPRGPNGKFIAVVSRVKHLYPEAG